MKKLIGGMFVGALLLAGCGGGEPTKPVAPPAGTTAPAAVCPKCNKTPCECKPIVPPVLEGEKKGGS